MKPKILIYINSYVAYHLDKAPIKKFLNNKIGHKNWSGFGDVVVPELLQKSTEYLTENFFHGVSAHQYTMIAKGGTFINPMLYGLRDNFDLWNDVLHTDSDFFQEVIFIDIPYELYDKVANNDEYYTDEYSYDNMSVMVEDLVRTIQDTYYFSTHKEVH